MSEEKKQEILKEDLRETIYQIQRSKVEYGDKSWDRLKWITSIQNVLDTLDLAYKAGQEKLTEIQAKLKEGIKEISKTDRECCGAVEGKDAKDGHINVCKFCLFPYIDKIFKEAEGVKNE